MEYCSHVSTGAPSCYLELLDKLQKQICRTVGPSLAAPLEPLAHHQNVASLSPFHRYDFGRCSAELAQLVPWGRSNHYSDRLHDYSVTFPRCCKDVYVSSFFFRTARLWNSLPIKCFPLIYDLSDCKPKINRHLLTVRVFLTRFYVCFNTFVLLFLVNSMPRSGWSALHGVNPNEKKTIPLIPLQSLIKFMLSVVYQDSWLLALPPKGNSKFEILKLLYEKIKFCVFKMFLQAIFSSFMYMLNK